MLKRIVCGLMAVLMLFSCFACGKKPVPPEPVSAVIETTKVLEGRDLNAGEFSFQLLDGESNVVATASNDAQGKVAFDAITYEEAGEFKYTIVEVKGDLDRTTYDEEPVEVTVTVTDGTEGKLVAEVVYGTKKSFTNVYEPEPVIVNPLTGEPLDDPSLVNRRPTAVMLNNIYEAMPQHGVSQADMIFEYNVEYGITRMVGFFLDPTKVGVIGSIRSARACFVETVLGMDAVYFHCGGSDEADYMMWDLDMDHFDEGIDPYYRDYDRYETRAWEHTLMTTGQGLSDFMDSKDWLRRDHYDGYVYPIQYVEDATPTKGETANDVYVRFSNYKTGVFNYDSSTGLYMVNQYGEPYIDGNTWEQVGVTNLIVLRTTVYNSGDAKGHMVIDLQGSDEGMFFCGGKCEKITWEKDSMYDPFVYYHSDGTPLDLQVGHTYVCVIAHDAELSYE